MDKKFKDFLLKQDNQGDYFIVGYENDSFNEIRIPVSALVGANGASVEIQYSTDGISWHNIYNNADRYMRLRVGNENWSSSIPIGDNAVKIGNIQEVAKLSSNYLVIVTANGLQRISLNNLIAELDLSALQITSENVGDIIEDGAIPANKLVANITNGELEYLSGVTSNIQNQLNQKLSESVLKSSDDNKLNWNSDDIAVTAKAIDMKIKKEVGNVQTGVLVEYNGNNVFVISDQEVPTHHYLEYSENFTQVQVNLNQENDFVLCSLCILNNTKFNIYIEFISDTATENNDNPLYTIPNLPQYSRVCIMYMKINKGIFVWAGIVN